MDWGLDFVRAKGRFCARQHEDQHTATFLPTVAPTPASNGRSVVWGGCLQHLGAKYVGLCGQDSRLCVGRREHQPAQPHGRGDACHHTYTRVHIHNKEHLGIKNQSDDRCHTHTGLLQAHFAPAPAVLRHHARGRNHFARERCREDTHVYQQRIGRPGGECADTDFRCWRDVCLFVEAGLGYIGLCAIVFRGVLFVQPAQQTLSTKDYGDGSRLGVAIGRIA